MPKINKYWETKPLKNYIRKSKYNKTYKNKYTKRELEKRCSLALLTLISILIFVSGYHCITMTNDITIENQINGAVVEETPKLGAFVDTSPDGEIDFSPRAVLVESVEEVDYIVSSSHNEVKEISAYSEFDSCHYPVENGCLVASGKIAKIGMVATNLHPFGTKLRIGNEIYVVEDRISKRYNHRYDIFTGYGSEAHKQALEFGIKYLPVEVIK